MSDELPSRHNWVPKLHPMGGAGLWMRSTEVKTHAACGRCGGSIRSHNEVCVACLRVSKRNQIRLDKQRSARVKPKPKPKDDGTATKPVLEVTGRTPDSVTGPGKVLTRKERRWAMRHAATLPDGPEWLRKIGLVLEQSRTNHSESLP